MSKKMASILMAYGFVLAGLGLVLQQVAPLLGNTAGIAGLTGGGLCVMWGIAAVAGLRGRTWASLTTIPVAIVLVSQAVHVWLSAAAEDSGTLMGQLVVTLMLVVTIGMVIYLFHGERSAEFYLKGGTSRTKPTSRRNEGESPETQAKR